jgi:hypothetical protein
VVVTVVEVFMGEGGCEGGRMYEWFCVLLPADSGVMGVADSHLAVYFHRDGVHSRSNTTRTRTRFTGYVSLSFDSVHFLPESFFSSQCGMLIVGSFGDKAPFFCDLFRVALIEIAGEEAAYWFPGSSRPYCSLHDCRIVIALVPCARISRFFVYGHYALSPFPLPLDSLLASLPTTTPSTHLPLLFSLATLPSHTDAES